MLLSRLARRSAPLLVATAIVAGCNDSVSTDPARNIVSDNSNDARFGSARFASSATTARYVTVRIDSTQITIPNKAKAIAIAENASGVRISGKTATWQSTNPKVAQVSATGEITGVSAGKATIIGYIDGRTGSAEIKVNAPTSGTTTPKLASIVVTIDSSSVTVANKAQAKARLIDSNGKDMTGTVTWSSSNNSVATVSSTGVVTGVAAGTATIKATSGSVSGSATISVVATPSKPAVSVASVTVSLAAKSIAAGATTQATATTKDASSNVLTGRTITWSSSNTAIATVSSSGLVTAKAAGTVNIIATSEGKSGQAALTVTAPSQAAVASVSVSLAATSVTAGATTQATATTRDASSNVLTGRTVTWSSSNTAIATVSSSGLVTAKAAGTVNIVATSGGKTGQATLTVKAAAPAPVASVSVSLSPASVTAGASAQATATLRDAANAVLTGRTITWSSSNTNVATVSSSGVVTAKAAGSATITATSEGKSGSATLTVTAPSAPSSPSSPSSGPAQIIFQDSFESGNLGYRQNGVAWISNSYVDVSNAIAHSGSRAARFNQGASKEWSELRFGNVPNLTEAYIQYYLYMPSGKESPYVGPKVVVKGGMNDKFFRLWGGDYNQEPGNKVGASLWGDGTNGVLGLEYEYTPKSGSQWGMGQGPNPLTTPFVNDQNRGRWLQIRIRAKTASAANNDGILQIWVDGKLVLSMTNMANYPGSGAKTYTEGYLLGWANNGYAAGQVMYIDDFTISTGGFPNQ